MALKTNGRIVCDRCGAEYGPEDGIAYYETKYNGVLCQFCYDDVREQMLDSIEI